MCSAVWGKGMDIPVFAGRHARFLFKSPIKVRNILISQCFSDVGDAELCLNEKLFGAAHHGGNAIGTERGAGFLFKQGAEGIGGHIQPLCDGIQGELFKGNLFDDVKNLFYRMAAFLLCAKLQAFDVAGDNLRAARMKLADRRQVFDAAEQIIRASACCCRSFRYNLHWLS